MKKYAIILLINIVLALLQLSFFSELLGVNFMPNFILAFSFAFLISDKFELSMFCAFTGGLFLDLFGVSTLGFSSLILCILLIVTYQMKSSVFRGQITLGFFILLSSVFYTFALSLPQIYFSSSAFVGAFLTLLMASIFGYAVRNFTREGGYKL